MLLKKILYVSINPKLHMWIPESVCNESLFVKTNSIPLCYVEKHQRKENKIVFQY